MTADPVPTPQPDASGPRKRIVKRNTAKKSTGRPISPKKLDANRRNSKKSTGPRTARGKERSRLNSLKHGSFAGDGILLLSRERTLTKKLAARFGTEFPPKDVLVRQQPGRRGAGRAQPACTLTALDRTSVGKLDERSMRQK